MKFFSILNTGDDRYEPIYSNFIHFLGQVGLADKHHLFSLSGFPSGSFNQSNFNKLVYKKLEITHDELSKGNSVFLSDLDIVFLRDPWDYLTALLADNDIVFQQDGNRNCTGFYVVKPTPETLDLFDISEPIDLGPDKTDQGYINRKLHLKKSFYKNLKIKVLNKNLFPFGNYWYKQNKKIEDPYIVHYNWVMGIDNKIKKMKKYNHWAI